MSGRNCSVQSPAGTGKVRFQLDIAIGRRDEGSGAVYMGAGG